MLLFQHTLDIVNSLLLTAGPVSGLERADLPAVRLCARRLRGRFSPGLEVDRQHRRRDVRPRGVYADRPDEAVGAPAARRTLIGEQWRRAIFKHKDNFGYFYSSGIRGAVGWVLFLLQVCINSSLVLLLSYFNMLYARNRQSANVLDKTDLSDSTILNPLHEEPQHV
jgi:hypothetical protein